MKTYGGKKSNSGMGGQSVFVCTNGVYRKLEHVDLHSPDGFNWGYGGSGPADLALSILTDMYGRVIAERYYQDFKWRFVAGFEDIWELSEEDIIKWKAVAFVEK